MGSSKDAGVVVYLSLHSPSWQNFTGCGVENIFSMLNIFLTLRKEGLKDLIRMLKKAGDFSTSLEIITGRETINIFAECQDEVAILLSVRTSSLEICCHLLTFSLPFSITRCFLMLLLKITKAKTKFQKFPKVKTTGQFTI